MFRNRYKSQLTETKADQTRSRIYILVMFVFLILFLIVMRLFQLQVVRHEAYASEAKAQHMASVELPAKRGDIYVKDTHSGELSKLATNTTLDLVYVDPFVANDRQKIADNLTPLLFPKEEYEACKVTPKDCFYDITVGNQLTKKKEAQDEEADADKTSEPEDYEFKDYQSVLQELSLKFLKDISKEKVDYVPLKADASPALMQSIQKENLAGITVDEEGFRIYGDPTLIPAKELAHTSQILGKYLEQSPSKLELDLRMRDVRYVALKNKLPPETSVKIRDMIKKLDLKGVVLIPEHWRFYPEGQLASNVVGFIDQEKAGQYGIEGYFNVELQGKKGSITAENDPNGHQITVGDAQIVNAVDGDSIVLTIDRIVQKEVEKDLAEGVKEFRADSGQVIVMDPNTGAIIAMANYPTFDPNDYSDSLKLRKYDPSADAELYKKMEIFKKDEKGKYIPVDKLKGDLENNKIQKYVYENGLGLGALKNKTISEYYEPGSTFKPLIMSIALDTGEVTPQTTYNNSGPIKLKDGLIIRNAVGEYAGTTTMLRVLEHSLNTGMVFVADKLGAKVIYSYLKNYGFGEYSNLGLEGEIKADLEYYTDWDPYQLKTTGYGQGIVVTPMQLITAWSAMANGGKLMQPYIVDSVIKEGKTIVTEPKVLNRVISEETSSIITSMLISTVKSYQSKIFKIPGYQIAGKTGTAQIAGPGGYEPDGDGHTITSFVGYAPAQKPKFIVLVKIDRPRIGAGTWGETTAGPVFRKIAEFMFDYYNIEPES